MEHSTQLPLPPGMGSSNSNKVQFGSMPDNGFGAFEQFADLDEMMLTGIIFNDPANVSSYENGANIPPGYNGAPQNRNAPQRTDFPQEYSQQDRYLPPTISNNSMNSSSGGGEVAAASSGEPRDEYGGAGPAPPMPSPYDGAASSAKRSHEVGGQGMSLPHDADFHAASLVYGQGHVSEKAVHPQPPPPPAPQTLHHHQQQQQSQGGAVPTNRGGPDFPPAMQHPPLHPYQQYPQRGGAGAPPPGPAPYPHSQGGSGSYPPYPPPPWGSSGGGGGGGHGEHHPLQHALQHASPALSMSTRGAASASKAAPSPADAASPEAHGGDAGGKGRGGGAAGGKRSAGGGSQPKAKRAARVKKTPEEQRADRRERNRRHARCSRARKKVLIDALQNFIKGLQAENRLMRSHVKERFGEAEAKALYTEAEAELKAKEEPLQASAAGGAGLDGTGLTGALVAEEASQATTVLEDVDFAFVKALKTGKQNFVITDPHLPDNPIVYASQGFLDITGYALDEVLGRNCRFIQGPATDLEMVATLRAAINSGTDTSVCLLNYRRDGTTFWNQVHLAPLRNQFGVIVNYVGVQCEVASNLALAKEPPAVKGGGKGAGGVGGGELHGEGSDDDFDDDEEED